MVPRGSCPRPLRVRKTAFLSAPSSLRQQSEFFRIITAGRISRCAVLLSEGTSS